jgi:ferredoxin-thioredoxin reductase catalytic chain
METDENILRPYKEHADKSGFRLNPNDKIVDATMKGLLRNEGKFGARYCPCRRVTGNKEEDKKIICPCVYHKDEIAKDGHCHCMLFVR